MSERLGSHSCGFTLETSTRMDLLIITISPSHRARSGQWPICMRAGVDGSNLDMLEEKSGCRTGPTDQRPDSLSLSLSFLPGFHPAVK